MARKLPKTIYVFRENEGADDECLSCWEAVDEIATFGETRLVGIYQLAETVKVTAEAKVVATG